MSRPVQRLSRRPAVRPLKDAGKKSAKLTKGAVANVGASEHGLSGGEKLLVAGADLVDADHALLAFGRQAFG